MFGNHTLHFTTDFTYQSVAKVILSQVCVCPQGGRVSASAFAYWDAFTPPDGETPDGREPVQFENHHPPVLLMPLRWRTTPPRWSNPPGWRTTTAPMENPPGFQALAYGQRAAVTHPTGMHSWSAN